MNTGSDYSEGQRAPADSYVVRGPCGSWRTRMGIFRNTKGWVEVRSSLYGALRRSIFWHSPTMGRKQLQSGTKIGLYCDATRSEDPLRDKARVLGSQRRTPCGQPVDFDPPSLAARTCGQAMDNIPVAHSLTTLIHRLPTFRRGRFCGNRQALFNNNFLSLKRR